LEESSKISEPNFIKVQEKLGNRVFFDAEDLVLKLLLDLCREADPLEPRWRSLNDHLSTRGKARFMVVMSLSPPMPSCSNFPEESLKSLLQAPVWSSRRLLVPTNDVNVKQGPFEMFCVLGLS